MSSTLLLEAPSISITSRLLESRISLQLSHWLQGVTDGPLTQFNDLAKTLAVVVFPVPRGPANKYAWAIRFSLIALDRVVTICSCPAISDRDPGLYLRAKTV